MKIEDRYLDSTYLSDNPEWDRQDAPWKADIVHATLVRHRVHPASVGCGAGDVLVQLARFYPDSTLDGYDISPQAAGFWDEHRGSGLVDNINYYLGDFHTVNKKKYDVLLMLDVFEHVRDPYTFLEMTRQHAKYFIFHIPLDLSASSVLRGKPLMEVRKKVGHLHFYTKELALETLRETGFSIIDWQYTGASLNSPNQSIRTKLARFPRLLAYFINKDWGVRLLGGETLIVIATV